MAARRRRLWLVPLCVFLGACGIVALFLEIFAVQQRERLRLQLELPAEHLARRLEDFVAARFAMLDHVRRHDLAGDVPSVEEWRRHVATIVAAFPQFQAINRIDPDGVIRWVAPLEGNEPAAGADLTRHPIAAPVLEKARRTGALCATPPIELLQGGFGFATYLPVVKEGRLTGFVNGVFRFQPLLEGMLREQERSAFLFLRIEDGGVEVGAMEAAGEPDRRFEVSRPVRIADRTWRLTVVPTRAFVQAQLRPIRIGLPLLGGLFALVLAWLARIIVVRTERVRESEERYRRIVETAQEGVVTLDASRRITLANEVFASLVGGAGTPPGEVQGRSIERWLDEEGRRLFAQQWEEVRQGRNVLFILTLGASGGEAVETRWSMSPLLDRDGRFEGALAMVSDLSAHRRLEERLRRAQRLEAIGRLAAGVAHDFNNLLVAILGAGEMLRERVADEEARGLVEEILLAGERGAQLTRRLLAFSRRDVVRPRAVRVARAIGGLEPLLRRLLGEDVSLHLDTSQAGEAAVRIDPGQLEQVVLNLVVNAREALPRGGRIWLRARREADEVVLEVEDDGDGVPAELAEKIFEPFFTTKPTGQGTGLGLATVRSIVEEAGGRIDVERGEAGGALFRVRLPVAAPSAGEEEEDGGARVKPPGGARVLVVEDERLVRETVRRSLERHGFEVLCAEDAPSALAIVEREERIDLVLTDIVMPGLSGVELGERVVAERPHTAVVLMTGYADTRAAGERALRFALLRKPFSQRELLEVVGAALAEAARRGG